jgi:hypothetical protein
MSDWNNKINDVITDISSIKMYLRRLSEGFKLTGNDKLSDELICIVSDLSHSCEVLGSIPNEILTERMRDIEQSNKIMLNATLAGIKLGLEQSNE